MKRCRLFVCWAMAAVPLSAALWKPVRYAVSNQELRADFGSTETVYREALTRFLTATNEPLTNWLDKNLEAPKNRAWSDLIAEPIFRLNPENSTLQFDWKGGPGFGRFTGLSNRETYPVDLTPFTTDLFDQWLKDKTWSNLPDATGKKLRQSLAGAFSRLFPKSSLQVTGGTLFLSASADRSMSPRLAAFTNGQPATNQLAAITRASNSQYAQIHNLIAQAIETEAESAGFFQANAGTLGMALKVEAGDVVDFAGMAGYRQWTLGVDYQFTNRWFKTELASNGGIWRWITNREAPGATAHREFQQIHPSEMRLRDQLPKTASTNLAARAREILMRRVFFGGWDEKAASN